MIAVLLALASAVSYGSSDFVAGVMSRRVHYAWVGMVGQAGATVLVFAALPFGGGQVSGGALLWGGLSGLGAAAGTVTLYRGLARGQMAVAGPISGVGSAALPVLVGLLTGERPSLVALAGVVVALPAVWLVASGDGGPRRGGLVEGAVEGLLAGLGFGLLFVALAQAPDGSGLWPTAAGQVTSLVAASAFVLVMARGHAVAGPLHGRTIVGVVASGALGGVATVTYLLASRHGLLVVVGVLAALYPGMTVLLARLVLREHASRWQLVGLALAAIAVVAISAG
ncbi:MAG: EamA family transporter [Streptosporangiales bacterium]